MKVGDAVEVYFAWCTTPKGPLFDWFKGYRFLRFDGNDAIVRNVQRGWDSRYPKDRVRKEQPDVASLKA